MCLLRWLGYGIIILAVLGGLGLLIAKILASTMHVDDECEPLDNDRGSGETKAIHKYNGKNGRTGKPKPPRSRRAKLK